MQIKWKYVMKQQCFFGSQISNIYQLY